MTLPSQNASPEDAGSVAPQPPKERRGSGKNAVLVGAGILLSRLSGLLRARIFAHYFGNSDAADVFNAALRIPNLLQNLFGEGALSASFIPVYSKLLASGQEEEANRIARVIGSLLAVVVSVLVLGGVSAAPLLVDLITPGFDGAKRDFTVRIVRILFPGVGVLVLSAWCLGVLNSHRRFFLPYAAPVLWNLAMIGALLGFGGKTQGYSFAEIVAWGAVAGSVLQFGVQVPAVLRLIRRFRFQLETASSNVRTVIRNFIPGVAGRGVNQVSAFVDEWLASFLQTGAMAQLAYAQTLYILPVSLFGMSISNAELPEMASQTGSDEAVAQALRKRLEKAMRRVSFFIIPTVAGFFALGDSIVALLYQTGKFTRSDVNAVWTVLAGATIGMLAATLGRLYTSAFYALRDTRTPLRFAVLRVLIAAALGWLLAFKIASRLDFPGIAGITTASGAAAWIEFALLRSAMASRIGKAKMPASFLTRLWLTAVLAAAPAYAGKLWLEALHPLILGPVVVLTYGFMYFGIAAAFRIPEALDPIRAARSRLRL